MPAPAAAAPVAPQRGSGRPRATPGAPLGAHAAQLREAGAAFLATRRAHQLAHRALVEVVAAALDDGVHYLDVAEAAGVSKRLPYRLAHASAAAGDKLTA